MQAELAMVNIEYAMDKALQHLEDFESICRYNANASVHFSDGKDSMWIIPLCTKEAVAAGP